MRFSYRGVAVSGNGDYGPVEARLCRGCKTLLLRGDGGCEPPGKIICMECGQVNNAARAQILPARAAKLASESGLQSFH